jgi:hypothetical protein
MRQVKDLLAKYCGLSRKELAQGRSIGVGSGAFFGPRTANARCQLRANLDQIAPQQTALLFDHLVGA